MAKALFLETSSPLGGLALVESAPDRSRVVTSLDWRRLASHSEVVTSSARLALERAGWQLSDLDFFAVGIGPGSFTGIRVALNMVRALAYATERPVQTFDSLRALALSSTRQELPLLTLTNAYKNLLFAGRYHWTKDGHLVEDLAPSLWTLDQLAQQVNEPVLCLGDGYPAYAELISPALKPLLVRDPQQPDEPRAEVFSLPMSLDVRPADLQNWKSVKPLYIRASEAEEKLRSGLLKPIQKI